MWLIAVGIVGDAAEAEDVVQDAAMIAYRKLDQFQPGTSFRAWVGTIVRNVALNSLRGSRRRRGVIGELAEAARMPGRGLASAQTPALSNHPGAPKPDASFSSMMDSRVVMALAGMGDVARACLLLRTVGELHYAEISALLAIPEGTAMSHVHRARAHLRKELAQVWEEHAGKSAGQA
jgi:RNA polymerase sigma-70 factor (ECF subfamily)